MPNNVVLGCKGLFTLQNKLELPKNALIDTKNVVINREGVIESRRGFKLYGTAMAAVAKQLLSYKGILLRHVNSLIQYDNGTGTFANLTGSSYDEVEAGVRIKGIESNSNFLFTTSSGIKKISANSSDISLATVGDAGGIKALDTKLALRNTLGFFLQDSKVAYRVVWGIDDKNSNRILGTPSSVAEISNPIPDLLATDYNNLLINLDKLVAPAVLANDTYLSSLKVSTGASANTLKNALIALGTAIDSDTDITEGTINTGSISISNYEASLVFSADVSTYLKVGDVIQISGYMGDTAMFNGTHTLTNVSTTTVKFKFTRVGSITIPIDGASPINLTTTSNPGLFNGGKVVIWGSTSTPPLDGTHVATYVGLTDFSIPATTTVAGVGFYSIKDKTSVNDTTGIVRRLKYSVGAFRTNEASAIQSNILGVGVFGSSVYIRTNGDMSTKVFVGDGVSVSDLTSTLADLNGTLSLIGMTTSSSLNDTLVFSTLRSDVVEDTSTAVTNGSLIVNTSVRILSLSSPQTSNELLLLQGYYDDVVSALQLEPAGIVSNTGLFDVLASTQSSQVDVNFAIPSGVTTDHFYQIYRTKLTTSSGVSALEDFGVGTDYILAYEAHPTTTEISAKSVTVMDITPDSFLGAYLYSNNNTGEGETQTNEVPPVAKDIALYRGYTFYGNTRTKQKINPLALLSTESLYLYEDIKSIAAAGADALITSYSHGLSNGNIINIENSNSVPNMDGTYTVSSVTVDTFKITGITISTAGTNNDFTCYWKKDLSPTFSIRPSLAGAAQTYTFVTGKKEISTIAFGVAESGGNYNGKYFLLNSADNINKYYVWYNASAGGTDPSVASRTGVEVTITTADTAITIAARTKAELFKLNDFTVTVMAATNTIQIKNNERGITDNIVNTGVVPSLTIVTTTAGDGEDVANKKVLLFESKSPSQSVDGTAKSMVRVINSNASESVYAFYLSSTSEVPGEILLEERALGGTPFYLNASALFSNKFNPDVLPSSDNTNFSSNEVNSNRIFYSKYQQPEAVPLLNYIDVGPKDKSIIRIAALRDSLFIIKEEGVYRLSGAVAPFQVALFDSSVRILAPDSAVVLSNMIYLLSDQGVCTVSDTGIAIISRPIENLLNKLSTTAYTNFTHATFGVAYESDRAYYLFTLKDPTDTRSTQCFRFNTFTNSWTVLDLAKNCGIVSSQDDKLYLAPNDVFYLEQERKTLDRTDYSDREVDLILLVDSISNGTEVILSTNVSTYAKGDTFSQVQYVTPSQYNKLIKRLDVDTGVTDVDYYSTLAMTAGQDMGNKLVALATKLDADTGITYSAFSTDIGAKTGSIASHTLANPAVITKVAHGLKTGRYVSISGNTSVPSLNGSYIVTRISDDTFSIPLSTVGGTATGTGTFATLDTSFIDMQGVFNIISDNLNNDSGVTFSNYAMSSGSVSLEVQIVAKSNQNRSITTEYAYPFIVGDVTIFKAFETTCVWAPQTMDDASVQKHVRESTMLFEDKSFTYATISYATDFSPDFEGVEFRGEGNGIFGGTVFGNSNFGGNGNSRPFRTYLPRNKQRGRYLTCKFRHYAARESYAIYGISFVYESVSTRAYK